MARLSPRSRFEEQLSRADAAPTDDLPRTFDPAGKNVRIRQNSFKNLGSVPGNDGEGILCPARDNPEPAGYTR